MPYSRQIIVAFAVLFASVFVACDKSDSSKNGNAQSAAATTQTTQTAEASSVPRVGIPVGTKESYKPVPGKYGGRLVRDELGEPKSFNPVVSSETSTSNYTQRMFEGLTRENPFTG